MDIGFDNDGASVDKSEVPYFFLRKFIFLCCCLVFCINSTIVTGNQVVIEKFRIYHVMSYHSPWKWTDDQLNGFKSVFKNIPIDYQIFQMDTKRNNSITWKNNRSNLAKSQIEEWQPHLLYLNDDNAQEYLGKYYIDSPIPLVFSGVNANPFKYGYVGSRNVTGVLEFEHFNESARLLKKLVPDARKIAVILDEGSTWEGVGGRILGKIDQLDDISIKSWHVIKTYADFKQTMRELQTTVDAVALLGIFAFKNDTGQNVSYKEVLRWTRENSTLPDFSLWENRVELGTLCAIAVSGWEQGVAAGKLAKAILIDKIKPSELPIKPTQKGEPAINITRAKRLGIKVPASLLISASISKGYK